MRIGTTMIVAGAFAGALTLVAASAARAASVGRALEREVALTAALRDALPARSWAEAARAVERFEAGRVDARAQREAPGASRRSNSEHGESTVLAERSLRSLLVDRARDHRLTVDRLAIGAAPGPGTPGTVGITVHGAPGAALAWIAEIEREAAVRAFRIEAFAGGIVEVTVECLPRMDPGPTASSARWPQARAGAVARRFVLPSAHEPDVDRRMVSKSGGPGSSTGGGPAAPAGGTVVGPADRIVSAPADGRSGPRSTSGAPSFLGTIETTGGRRFAFVLPESRAVVVLRAGEERFGWRLERVAADGFIFAKEGTSEGNL